MSQLYISIDRYHEHLIPEMVEIKYGLMSKNIYSFFRGTCHLYYEDLSTEKNIPLLPLV